MEITRELKLSDAQMRTLDLHSFLNVLNVLATALQLIAASSGDDARMAAAIARTREMTGWLDDPAKFAQRAGNLEPLRALTLDAVDAVLAAREWEAETRADIAEARDNIGSVFDVLRVRLAEWQARLAAPKMWIACPIAEVAANLTQFLAAVEKNSRGRYRIVRNIAEHDAGDYLVHLEISSVNGETIFMPPVFQDVMRDLVANARKYTAVGGQIDAGLLDDGRELVLRVADTGRGIPADELETVVEFGARGSNTQDIRTHGAGFGLTKAYLMTRAFSGRFFIDSTLGQGTTITIRLPHPQSPPHVP